MNRGHAYLTDIRAHLMSVQLSQLYFKSFISSTLHRGPPITVFSFFYWKRCNYLRVFAAKYPRKEKIDASFRTTFITQ
uniref:Uncharacterized protein n=1 Tax=Parascaris univalens TaxID=6257 RepID=A0A915CBJ0_PARUN